MSKMQRSNKEAKKQAMLTMKEKRSLKRSRKDSRETPHLNIPRGGH